MAKVSNNWQNKLKDFAIMNMILFGSQKILGMENGKETRASNLIIHEQQNDEVSYENLLQGGLPKCCDCCHWDCKCNPVIKNGWFWTGIIGGALAGIGVGIYLLVDYLNKKDEPTKGDLSCNDLFSKCPFKNLTQSLNSTLNYLNLTNGTDFCFGDMKHMEDKYGFIFNNNSNCTLYTSIIEVSNSGSIFTDKKIESVDLLKLPKDCNSTSLMFNSVKGLKSVNLRNINTEKVVNTSLMFGFNPLLNNITGLDKLNFSKVIDTRGMFAYTSLTTIDLNGFNNSKVKFADGMFAYIPSLKTIKNLLFIGTNSLETAAGMFYNTGINNTAIQEVEKWNTSNLTDVEGIFTYLHNVKNISLTNWDTNKIKNAKSMFEGSEFDNITLKEFNSLENANSMFMGANIGSIIGLENLKLQNLKFVKSMFSYFSSNGTINLTKLNTSKIKSAEEMFNNATLKTLVLRRFDNLENANSMFMGANIGSIIGLENLELPNLKFVKSMFSGFSGQETINLTNLNTSEIKNAEEMFSNAELNTLVLRRFDNLEDAKAMFKNANISDFDLENVNLKNLISAESMFEEFKGCEKIDLNYFNTAKLISTVKMFKNAKVKEYLLSGLASKNLIDMTEMFTSSLAEQINLDGWKTKNSLITTDAFMDCNSLKHVYLSMDYNLNIVTELVYEGYTCEKDSITELDLGIDSCEKPESPEEEEQGEEEQEVEEQEVEEQEEEKQKEDDVSDSGDLSDGYDDTFDY